jgi:hypothetical protein
VDTTVVEPGGTPPTARKGSSLRIAMLKQIAAISLAKGVGNTPAE